MKVKYLLIILSIFLVFNISVVYASDAKTLKELRGELSALKSKKSKQDSEKKKTQSEISTAQNSIYDNKTAITKGQEQIENSKKLIEELKVEIEDERESINSLMNSYQVVSGDNIYLDYVFSAESYADLVYRYSVVSQIIDYSNNKIEEWEDKVSYNEELQVELKNKEIELNKQIEKLESDLDSLGKDLSEIVEITMDINDEIKSTQELIDFYVDMGCSETENLEQCVAVKGDTKFKKPLTKGTITSYYGYRTSPIKKKTEFHNGVDIGGNSQGTNIYATANGMVGKIVRKSSCGGNEVFIYHTIGGQKYTSFYFHMYEIKVSVGDTVTSGTVIGTVGGGNKTPWDGCSTGAHLHFGLGTGWYGKTYSSYSTLTANTVDPQKMLNLPNKGTYWYSR